MKIQILYFIDSICSGGGIQEQALRWIQAIDRSKFQIDILGYRQLDANGVSTGVEEDYSRRAQELGCRVFVISPLRLGYLQRNLKEVAQFFKAHGEYQILHAHATSKALAVMCFARKNGIRNIILHGHNSHFASKNPLKVALGNLLKIPARMIATDYFACSSETARFLFGNKICCAGNYDVIPNAIDCGAYRYKPELRAKVRAREGWNEKFVLLHVGRFHRQKNHLFLIDAFHAVCRRDPDAILALIGTTMRNEDKIYTQVKEKVKAYGIEDKVLFMGYRNDVSELLQGADVFLFPSLFEGLGIACLEAQAVGLPCVVSDKLPPEVKVTDRISFLSLDSTEPWAEQIEAYKNLTPVSTTADFISKGYEIGECARMLEEKYVEIANRDDSNKSRFA